MARQTVQETIPNALKSKSAANPQKNRIPAALLKIAKKRKNVAKVIKLVYQIKHANNR